MLRVVTGRFHPSLESSLVDHVRRTKAADPLAPIAIIVPSKPLADRIRTLFTVGHRLSVLNLYVLTFHQLALRLAGEESANRQLPRVVDELFFEQLIRHIVRSKLSSQAPLQRIGQSSGTWGALWATMRDLKDADVDPVQVLQGIREGYFDEDDREWLGALISLYASVKEVGKTLEVGTQDDLAAQLIPCVPTAPFLQSLREVLYYGFYDLTQVQLSLFEAISRVKETTLFFPLEDDPAFGFARRFFDRCIQPLVMSDDGMIRLEPELSTAAPKPIHLTIRSVIGPEEELAAVCRTILDLVETNGYRFDEIGVTARTLDPYSLHLRSIFDHHRIPFRTTAVRPLIQEPICKLVLQLAGLTLNDFYRASVLDVVTSPLYATNLYDGLSESYRPEQWKLLVQVLHITHGVEEWKRLDPASRAALILDGEESIVGSLTIAPDVISLLWQVVSQLIEDCSALPTRGTIGQMVIACRALIERSLCRPGAAGSTAEDVQLAHSALTWDAIDHIWTTLMELEPLNDQMTWAEFVELLAHTFERTTKPLHDASPHGVMVFDVMAARGVPFKALFVLGLNEKVFPRYIREDAFLRDRHRRVLDSTLGFKIDEKLTAYGEEALLFHLSRQAAGQRLYLSHQRADESGRMLAASPYLGEARRWLGHDEQPIDVVPRRLTDRLLQQPATKMFLTPAELTQWLALNAQDPTELMVALGRDAEIFRHAAAALDRIEEDGATLNLFDGMTGAVESHWTRLVERGVAPTPLERYARCPFQYFAADILRLEPSRVSVGQEPDAALVGTLCHSSLRRCYEQLVQAGWPTERVTDEAIQRTIRSSVELAATDLESQYRTGPYLLWELAKELIVTLATAAVEADEKEQAEHPYTPVAFEIDGEGTVPGILEEGALKVRGRIDRLDRNRNSGALQVLDYKFKVGSAMKAEDRNLAQSAVRGYRLQPPLYSCLTVPGQAAPSAPSRVQFLFLAPRWSTAISRSTFNATSWTSETGILIQKSIRTLVDGIRSGRFFILPDGYCDGCEFRVMCRREHAPTWWRAYRAAEPKVLKMLRTQKIADE
ncbi:MAG: PD-(D/E)XK nuclease family protein [Nitrospira sp. BO4]|jgi:ATP-dependent helicase/nuclease subunit B|nr:PD-(D/E)XK nuclease family protein [Nitrospira sp. BO4]